MNREDESYAGSSSSRGGSSSFQEEYEKAKELSTQRAKVKRREEKPKEKKGATFASLFGGSKGK